MKGPSTCCTDDTLTVGIRVRAEFGTAIVARGGNFAALTARSFARSW